ncbi:CDP-2,3-bis-(O-geranylgeranyl)-sn-glycerol synthase [Candidatus Micrarchaeota archaeon]|nr:CDP-2,3-bis-(O-geranylgeranyl)-sn-glycerol synthase [Candidatus Micrarchaeota archaeon]
MLDLLVFLIPAYIANSSPVVLGGGAPLDFGIKLNGKRILGEGKTIRGFAGGTLAGATAGIIVAWFYPLPFFASMEQQMAGALMLALGTLVGDSLGSFLKRRLGMESGSPFFPDTFIFLIVALAFAWPFVQDLYSPFNLVFFFGLTIILHPAANFLANRAGLKKVPW